MSSIRLLSTLAAISLSFMAFEASAGVPSIALASASTGGAPGNARSAFPQISSDGSLVAFSSNADNLVAGDQNNACPPSIEDAYFFETDNCTDIFIHSAVSGQTERAGIGLNGEPPNSGLYLSDMSPDGRFIGLTTRASNISLDDTDSGGMEPPIDGFVYDRQSGTAEKVNIDTAGQQIGGLVFGGPFITDDGRFAVFATDAPLDPSDTNTRGDAYLRDLVSNTTTWVSVRPGSGYPYNNSYVSATAISGDATQIIFGGTVTDFVPDATNFIEGLLRYDVALGTIHSLSKAPGFAYGPAGGPSINANGRYIAFTASGPCPGSVCPLPQVFRHDLQTGATEMVSSNQGVPGDGYSSRGYGAVTLAGISDDGRYIAFESESRNLVGIETFGCNNVYFRDMQTDAPVLISLSDTGMLARGTSRVPVISGDGTAVAFESDARSLVPGDTNGVTDVFVARPSATPVAVTPTGDTSTCNDVPVGDLDCSGAVTAQDVLHLLRALMHIPPYAECRYYSAVFDCFSGKVSALQALAILRYILNGSGLLDCSNVGK